MPLSPTTPGPLHRRTLQTLLVAGLVLAAGGAACDGKSDDLLASSTAGEDSLSLTAPAFEHTVTSDDYVRWLAAEEALARVSGFELEDAISLETATEEDIDRAADALEGNEPVRLAIESSGLSVKEYVQTTVALEQALNATARRSDSTGTRIARANTLLAEENRTDIERVRTASPFRVSSTHGGDASDSDSDGKGNRGKGKKKGKGKKNGKG